MARKKETKHKIIAFLLSSRAYKDGTMQINIMTHKRYAENDIICDRCKHTARHSTQHILPILQSLHNLFRLSVPFLFCHFLMSLSLSIPSRIFPEQFPFNHYASCILLFILWLVACAPCIWSKKLWNTTTFYCRVAIKNGKEKKSLGSKLTKANANKMESFAEPNEHWLVVAAAVTGATAMALLDRMSVATHNDVYEWIQ